MGPVEHALVGCIGIVSSGRASLTLVLARSVTAIEQSISYPVRDNPWTNPIHPEPLGCRELCLVGSAAFNISRHIHRCTSWRLAIFECPIGNTAPAQE
ncbi:uncharacterized protein LAESUDRAFT_320708 [Laetiporus sulphureus 93-53]|uniref:Uncharacterized protein n=1 Tax=Laetiporus sulphureus 93-53 TaxID=1314785 RepID=A0A165D1E3_9APHY|nr:uncharacterized protein LAESUDRAFT_320708 [Laetiporus sulphureus 93-53]KZT03951.1 hypothetical protein LAESUDRAFT_320708 [Laetiporus sulphureus 93-53]